MKAISVVAYQRDIKRLADGKYESGDRVASKDQVQSLIGGSIYHHDGQREPSFHGGVIVDAYPAEGKRRWVFVYEARMDHKGVVCKGAWGREKCYWESNESSGWPWPHNRSTSTPNGNWGDCQ